MATSSSSQPQPLPTPIQRNLYRSPPIATVTADPSRRRQSIPSPLVPIAARVRHAATSSGNNSNNILSPSSVPNHHQHHRTSLLNGIKELIGRPRSGSVGSGNLLNRQPRRLERKVKVPGCQLSSVYDLRESNEDGDADFYDDEFAFRRPRSNSSDFLILRKTSRPLSIDVVGIVDKLDDPYRQYLSVVDCYDLAPHAGTMVVLDSELPIAKAFISLCESGQSAALVWDSQLGQIRQILTYTDFISMLLVCSDTNEMRTLDECLRDDEDGERELVANGRGGIGRIITVSADCKLLEVCQVFCDKRIHRIPVIETSGGNSDILYLINLKRILQAHRSLHFAPWMGLTMEMAQIGTWDRIFTVSIDSRLDTAAQLMIDNRLSSVPVIANDQQSSPAIDVLTKSDIIQLLIDTNRTTTDEHRPFVETFRECQVRDALNGRIRIAPFCSIRDNIADVIDRYLLADGCIDYDYPCVYALDDSSCIRGCVSVSDLIRLIMNQRLFEQLPNVTNQSTHL